MGDDFFEDRSLEEMETHHWNIGMHKSFCDCNPNDPKQCFTDGQEVFVSCDKCEKTWNAITGEVVEKTTGHSTQDDMLALRKMAWINHGCLIGTLYGDDGEMQCSSCRIDFKRDPVKLIVEKLRERAVTKLQNMNNK